MEISIRAYRAINNNEACYKHADGHKRVLEAYGVTKVTSANLDWITNPNTYVIQAETIPDGRVLGGGRIQLAGGQPLPIEEAIKKLDPSIIEVIKKRNELVTGEFCGLWNSREIAGMGIGSIFLSKAMVAVSGLLEMGSLFALCASYTIEMGIKTGFVIDTSLGNNGTFYYPKDDFIATVMILKDPITLSTADIVEREYIMNLRKNPNQIIAETSKRGTVEIHYQLDL